MPLKTDNGPAMNPKGDPGAAGPTPPGGLWPVLRTDEGTTRNMPVGPDPMPGRSGKPPFLK
jgi:hypothetical protein